MRTTSEDGRGAGRAEAARSRGRSAARRAGVSRPNKRGGDGRAPRRDRPPRPALPDDPPDQPSVALGPAVVELRAAIYAVGSALLPHGNAERAMGRVPEAATTSPISDRIFDRKAGGLLRTSTDDKRSKSLISGRSRTSVDAGGSGERELQNRVGVGDPGAGGFDSHAPSPLKHVLTEGKMLDGRTIPPDPSRSLPSTLTPDLTAKRC